MISRVIKLQEAFSPWTKAATLSAPACPPVRLLTVLPLPFAASQDAAHDIDTLLRHKVSTVGSMRRACPCLAARLMCGDMRLAAGARVRAPSSQHTWRSCATRAVTLWLTRGSQSTITARLPLSLRVGDVRPPSLCSGCSRPPAYCCLCSLSVMNRTDY